MKQHEPKASAKPPEEKPPVVEPTPPPAEVKPPVEPTPPPAEPEVVKEKVDPTVVLASLLNAYPSDLVTAAELNAKLTDCREDLDGPSLDAFETLVVLCAVAGVSTPIQFNAMAQHLGLKVRMKAVL